MIICLKSIDEKQSLASSPTSLRQLCQVTKDACVAVTPMLKGEQYIIYRTK